MAAEIVTALLAFLGGGLGSGLAFWATRSATRTEREARRREEWGRRFTSALDRATAPDSTSRAAGRALMEELLDSGLADDDDRRAARAVLDAIATAGHTNLRLLLPATGNLDDLRVVRDNRDEDPPEGGLS